MAKLTERTSFTKDVEGRYLCNDVSEVNAWTSAGGRPFDVIVVGGGTFGSAIAEHVWYRQKQVGGGLRTLVIEAGLFTIPEHVQNTGIRAVLSERKRSPAGAPAQRGLGGSLEIVHPVQRPCLHGWRPLVVLGWMVAALARRGNDVVAAVDGG